MRQLLSRQYWHDLFELGVLFKALNSLWETLGGIFLLTRLHTWLTATFLFLSKKQLLGDRDDFLFKALEVQVYHLDIVSTRTFVGLYLLFHGCMNAFLAYNLFRNRLWAYPFSIVFVSVFFVYQLYRLTHTHSVVLLLISILDAFFIFLTWHEWEYQLKHQRR